MSNEKRAPGCLGYTGDEILPSYVGIILNHYKEQPTREKNLLQKAVVSETWDVVEVPLPTSKQSWVEQLMDTNGVYIYIYIYMDVSKK